MPLESKLMRQCQVAASAVGARLFRNNVGLGWTGKSIHISEEANIRVFPGDVVIRSARPLHAGLAQGSSDLIGFQPVLITQDMVGTQVAVFTAAEIKQDGGVVSVEQRNFLRVVKEAGGIAFIAKSVGDMLLFLRGQGGKQN